MDELIQQLISKLGIDESVANAATGKAMAMVKEHAGDELFGKIAAAVPGAVESAAAGSQDAAGGAAASGGGMLGKLAGMASSALGGSAGGGLELGAALSGAGLDSDKMGGFVSMVIAFLKEKAGDEVMEQVLNKFPMLKTLLG
ncbi:hypothetical protein K227x_45900 [Rubripirellula lacrimiformis]|uniref:DUF2267 domain-containing protein n=1 Tax=Rubripirellula lacrimiformis TaxID=1930273 RepID=A0A517NGC6_9BACT|nr:DUF2780 domain-containing protein [Rubripirellula lacrimiformis]QDT06182.1 hypothetical protein K227x_45900 [Rubripirellula lacrimiformis]